jgi:hypothetical protein
VSKVTEGCDGQMKNILIVGEDPGAPKSCENTSRLVGSTREVTIHAGSRGVQPVGNPMARRYVF